MPGAEAELDPEIQELQAAAQEAEAEVRPQLPTGTLEREEAASDEVLRIAAQEPRLGVIKLVTEIEVRVRDLASITGHESPQRVPWTRLVGWLVEKGTVPRGVGSAAELLASVRNLIVHGRDREVRERDVAAAIDSGLTLLRVLEAIPDHGYEVRAMVPIYRDQQAEQEHAEGRGVVLWDFNSQGQRRTYRVYPTRRSYEEGQRVGWQWSFDQVWGEAYWRDPWDGDQVKLAWSESAGFIGQPLIRQPDA